TSKPSYAKPRPEAESAMRKFRGEYEYVVAPTTDSLPTASYETWVVVLLLMSITLDSLGPTPPLPMLKSRCSNDSLGPKRMNVRSSMLSYEKLLLDPVLPQRAEPEFAPISLYAGGNRTLVVE